MELESLRDLYVHELRDLYNAESQLVEAFADFIEAAGDPDLRSALRDHLEETREQMARIENVCRDLDREPTGQKCHGMEGLIQEARSLLDEDAEPEVRDAGLIAAIQRIEHYEMAGYGTARTYAEKLERFDDADTLQMILNEEALADQELSRLAERKINVRAAVAA